MENFLKVAVVFVVACLTFALFFGLPVMWLWNTCLVGAVDGVHPISFTRALGIVILVALLTFKADMNKETND